MVRLNNAMPPFNNKALRQAVSYAVNRDQVVTAIYFDQARPAYGPISPVYREYYDPAVSRYGYQYDPQKAKAKLAEGGQPNGFTFTLEIYASPEQTRLAELIQAQLADVGITAKIQAYEIATLIDRVTAKRFQAEIGSWTPRPDIDGTMYNHFSTRGNVNSVSYNNPTVDALLEKTRTIPDGPERVQLYRQIQHMIIDDAPWIFLGLSEPDGRDADARCRESPLAPMGCCDSKARGSEANPPRVLRRVREYGCGSRVDVSERHARRHPVRTRGSSTSRMPSPKRLRPSTVIMIATPGATAAHGARSRNG